MRIKNIKIEDRGTEEHMIYTIEDSFIFKLVESLSHATNHYSEGLFLINIGSQFTNPVFPQCHLVLLDKSQKAN